MSGHLLSAHVTGAVQLNIVWSFFQYLSNAFFTNPDFRNGFLSAVLIGGVLLAVKRVTSRASTRVQTTIAQRKESKVVVEEPTFFTGVAKNARRALGLAMVVAILIILF